jgi:hypothetical protein
MNMLYRLWIVISVLWVLLLAAFFEMGVDQSAAAWAAPYFLMAAVALPALMLVVWFTLKWIVFGGRG